MEAKELRIGNLIYGVSDRIETVIGLGSDTISAYPGKLVDAQMFFTEDDFTPIPLTEEWLIKFGFEKHHLYSEQYNKDNYSIVFCKDNCIDFWIADCDDCGVAVKIPFVHQLQNLYFALTGEELGLQGV